ncbi:hypothetical protein [Brachyspira hyodysenteriae]|uniref:hypothetical protein n=1 Tax=Brachyspira hyodysenteriae TaxID=159 RepID=UPI0022CD6742|nr:hypothetical protein [Brachyspira hyodysenteriae]MCZ9896268.1 hypothetical protein [Brachyspira hyodysenteriae]
MQIRFFSHITFSDVEENKKQYFYSVATLANIYGEKIQIINKKYYEKNKQYKFLFIKRSRRYFSYSAKENNNFIKYKEFVSDIKKSEYNKF